ncbi:MAG: amino acid efflux transporter [Thermoproteota archaeon]
MSSSKLSIGEGIVYAIGSIIGSGILFLPSLTYLKSGSDVLVVWVIATLLCIPLLQMFYHMVSKYPSNSMEKYFSEALGESVGDFLPILIFFTVILGMSASAVIVGGFFSSYFDLPILKVFIAVYLILFGFFTNIKGISFGAKIQYVTTTVLFLICLVIFIFTFPEASSNYKSLTPVFNFSGIGEGILVAFWAFAGFENLSFLASKFENPKRDFIISLVVALVFCGFFYFALTANYASLIPLSEVKLELGLYQLASKVSNANAGALVVTIFSLFAVKVNFNSWVAGVSSLISESKVFSNTFVAKKNKNDTPINAMLLLTVSFLIFSMIYYFFPFVMKYALEMVSANFIFIYVLCLFSFLKLGEMGKNKIVAIITLIIFCYSMVNTGLTAAYPILILVLYTLFRKLKRKV